MTPPTPRLYLVGGAVRDTLLQRPVKDRDYVLVGSIEADIIARWPSAKRVGKAFPVYLIDGVGEVALARRERKTGPRHQDFAVEFGPEVTLEEDDFSPPPSSSRQIFVEAIATTSRLPHRQHPGDAGYDLYANETLTINVGAIKLVRCGIRIAIPRGVVGFICPRSGMALKRGVTVLNGPGVIDPGFEDELGVVLINLGDRHFEVAIGDRIAQIVFVDTAAVEVVAGAVGCRGEVEAGEVLATTRRGGFGSSGGFGEALGQRGNEERDKLGPSRK